jgi:hypothetical protein
MNWEIGPLFILWHLIRAANLRKTIFSGLKILHGLKKLGFIDHLSHVINEIPLPKGSYKKEQANLPQNPVFRGPTLLILTKL